MPSQQERLEEAYQHLKNSEDHDWQRVVYESPNGQGWNDTEGYLIEAEVAGVGAVKVVSSSMSETIPMDRVVRVHTVEEPDD